MATAALCSVQISSTTAGTEVSGTIAMPDVCSPEVSPAVVFLQTVGVLSPSRQATTAPAEVALVNQKGLQFVPRVQAITLGQSLRFTNEDNETHNVHIVSSGNEFNQSMIPGQPRDFTPSQSGVVRLACDIHSHMRGYVVVSDSPWVQVCTARGRFRLLDVPDGRYRLTVWHEMGEPLHRDVTVVRGEKPELGILTLSAPAPVRRPQGQAPPARKWADVIDRIGLLLSSSIDAVSRPYGFKKARRLAEDAYWVEFEASEMETAVRLHLGFVRASELERRFRAMVPALRKVDQRKVSAAGAIDATRPLLLALVKAAEDLNRKGVTDAERLHALASASSTEPFSVDSSPASGSPDPAAQLLALKQGFDRVLALADKGEPDDAAATMTSVYFDEFEPTERFIAARLPAEVRPLEICFNAIRGDVGLGLKGKPLAARLDALRADVSASIDRGRMVPSGAFGPAFGLSLVTIVREGVEVILLLTMLIALAGKTGQSGALRSIAWGVVLAVFASGATALALNRMVASAQGRTRELLEGGVMMAAAGVLFYVSYWLISQSESKRWMNFLKRQATRSTVPEGRWGGNFTMLATAFLAVYREGAETALMYQAMISTQAGARAGLSGLAAGLGVGLVLLAAIAYILRATSLRLPLRAFFQVTGAFLFALAVVFAGNGVFELQSSGLLKLTPLAWTWLGNGLPVLGIYPNVQALSVQALLLGGAALALVVLLPGDPSLKTRPRHGPGLPPTAGVGV
ncbi:MAG: hypothetical protein NVSMB9_31140 [Isosphaeraceae bacterium]